MEVLNYITQQGLVLIPALVIIGQIIKNIALIPDKYIPLILLAFGLVGAGLLCGWDSSGVIQGVLVTGTAVYGNQVWKQLGKSE